MLSRVVWLVVTTSVTASDRSARWPMLGALAWVAVVAGLGQVMFAAVWHDDLADCSRGMLTVHLAAFMCQTFAYHAGVAMLPVMLLALVCRRNRLLIAAGLVCAIGAGPELASVRPRLNRAVAEGDTLKVMSVNLMYGHGDVAALLEQIERRSPDVLVFQEWTDGGAAQLRERLTVTYPHVVTSPRADAFGQAVFSKRPFVQTPREYPPVGGFREPQFAVTVDLAGRPLRIVDVHLLPPISLLYFGEQRRNARELARWATDPTLADRPDVLVGDFNATSRAGTVQVLTAAGMRDAQEAAGWWRGSTWPRTGLLAWAPGIQLDHALCGPRVECVGAWTGEDFGSDHRPVIVEVRWKTEGSAGQN